jgi:hypothetical protein
MICPAFAGTTFATDMISMTGIQAKLAERAEQESAKGGQYAASMRQPGSDENRFKEPFAESVRIVKIRPVDHGEFGPTRIGGPSA